MIASNSRSGSKVIRVDMSNAIRKPSPHEDADAVADMHMLALMEEMAALRQAETDGRITDAIKRVVQRIKDGGAAAKKAKEEEHEKSKESQSLWKTVKDKWKNPHEHKETPTAVVPSTHPHPTAPVVIEFPDKYAARMDKYLETLTALLEKLLEMVITKNQEQDEPLPDVPDSDEAPPPTTQSGRAQQLYYILQKSQ
jgi:hypothetical protein